MEINREQVLKNLDLVQGGSIGRAMQLVGDEMEKSADPLSYANSIITKLGGNEQFDQPTARLMAKALVEQAMVQDVYNAVKALEIANEKVERVKAEMPYLFVQPVEGVKVIEKVIDMVKIKQPRGKGNKKGSKRVVAAEIYDRLIGNGLEAVYDEIQKALNVSKTNAYTYVYLIKKDRGIK
jgi:hypothetical protein